LCELVDLGYLEFDDLFVFYMTLFLNELVFHQNFETTIVIEMFLGDIKSILIWIFGDYLDFIFLTCFIYIVDFLESLESLWFLFLKTLEYFNLNHFITYLINSFYYIANYLIFLIKFISIFLYNKIRTIFPQFGSFFIWTMVLFVLISIFFFFI
jgi:hypothetical protein